MKSLVLTSAEFPDFTDKQMQLICDIYNMPVTTHMFCLHLEASVQKMAFEPRGAKEKLQLLVLLLNIGDEGGIENPNKELSLTLRKLIFFGIFGGQLFAKDVKKIGELCSMLSDLIGDSSLEGSKYGPEAVLFAMEPFIQGKVDRIPGCLVHKVAQLIEKYKVEGICFSRYFLFFVAACSKYDWSSDTGIFEQMLKWIRDWIRTRDVVREYAALYSSLKAVLFDSGHVLNPPLTIMAFKIILLLMDRDNKIRESMRQKKRYVMDYARYILSNIKLDGVESHEYVFRDQLSGNKPCEGPIERTLSKDFVEASEEERSAKITELRQPKLPSKCSESEELKSLIETLKPWQTEESATVIVKHLLDNSSTNDRAAFVYFLCAWNHVDGDVSTWISAVETTNVFYEFGMAVALGKMILPICYSESFYEKNVSGITDADKEECEHHIGCYPWRKILFEFYGIFYKNDNNDSCVEKYIKAENEDQEEQALNTTTHYMPFHTVIDKKYGFKVVHVF